MKAKHMTFQFGNSPLLPKSSIVSVRNAVAYTSFLLYRTLLLKRVATKAATTTMDTTILTVVETVVMLNVSFLLINAREMKSRIMS
jgi:hypothetical protein